MEIDWTRLGEVLGALALAYALALPIGLHRERSRAGLGLRTFPLVAVASCSYVLLADAAFPTDSEARSRVIQGLVTGIGFVGGGAILKKGDTIKGTATAASIWSTGAIGATVANGDYYIATAVSAINLITFAVLTPIEQRIRRRKRRDAGDRAPQHR